MLFSQTLSKLCRLRSQKTLKSNEKFFALKLLLNVAQKKNDHQTLRYGMRIVWQLFIVLKKVEI